MFSLDRRAFLSVLAGAVACSSEPSSAPEAEAKAAQPILDFHCHTLHLGRTNEQLVAHQSALGVTKTVLLPGAGWLLERIGGNEHCAELAKTDPNHFVPFANADSAEDDAVDTLAPWLDGDARGIGEQKFNVPVDGKEMRRIFDLAREQKAPVLVHFEHEMYNLGIQNFSKILEEYHDVTFLGAPMCALPESAKPLRDRSPTRLPRIFLQSSGEECPSSSPPTVSLSQDSVNGRQSRRAPQ